MTGDNCLPRLPETRRRRQRQVEASCVLGRHVARCPPPRPAQRCMNHRRLCNPPRYDTVGRDHNPLKTESVTLGSPLNYVSSSPERSVSKVLVLHRLLASQIMEHRSELSRTSLTQPDGGDTPASREHPGRRIGEQEINWKMTLYSRALTQTDGGEDDENQSN